MGAECSLRVVIVVGSRTTGHPPPHRKTTTGTQCASAFSHVILLSSLLCLWLPYQRTMCIVFYTLSQPGYKL